MPSDPVKPFGIDPGPHWRARIGQGIANLLEAAKKGHQKKMEDPLKTVAEGALTPPMTALKLVGTVAAGIGYLGYAGAKTAVNVATGALAPPGSERAQAASESLNEFMDLVTGGYSSKAKQYYEEWLSQHPYLSTDKQKVAAIASYAVQQAPVDIALHTLGTAGEPVIQQLAEGDMSGAASDAILGAAMFVPNMGGLATKVAGKPWLPRFMRRMLEAKGMTGDPRMVSIHDIEHALGKRLEKQVGTPIYQAAMGEPGAVPITDVVPPASASTIKSGPSVPAAVEVKALAPAKQMLTVEDVVTKKALKEAEAEVNRAAQFQTVTPDDVVRNVMDEVTGRKPEPPKIDPLKDLAEQAQRETDQLFQKLRDPKTDRLTADQVFDKLVELASQQKEPLRQYPGLLEAATAADPLWTERVLELGLWRNIGESVVAHMAELAPAYLQEVLKTPDVPLTHVFARLVQEQPDVGKQILASALALSGKTDDAAKLARTKEAVGIVNHMSQLISKSSTYSGSNLQVSSEFINAFRAWTLGEGMLLDEVQRVVDTPPASLWPAIRWFKQAYGKISADVLAAEAMAKSAKRIQDFEAKRVTYKDALKQDLPELPEATIDWLAADPAIKTVLKRRGLPVRAMNAAQAHEFLQKVADKRLVELDLPSVVLTEDPFPGMPLADVPQALKTAVARVRVMQHGLGPTAIAAVNRAVGKVASTEVAAREAQAALKAQTGGSGLYKSKHFEADISDEVRLLEAYTRYPEPNLGWTAQPPDVRVRIETMGPLARWANVMTQASATFALSYFRSMTRDVLNTFAVSATRLGDKLIAGVIEKMTPGPTPTLDGMAALADHLFHQKGLMRGLWEALPTYKQLIDDSQRLLAELPRMSDEFHSVAIPIELSEVLLESKLTQSLDSKVAVGVQKAGAVFNMFRIMADRSVRSALFAGHLMMELGKRGIHDTPHAPAIQIAMDMLKDPENAPKVKEALWMAMQEAAEASLAANPASPEAVQRAIDLPKIKTELQDLFGTEKVSVQFGDMRSFGYTFLDAFKRIPALRWAVTLYPRFMYNLFSYMHDHNPMGMLALMRPEFRKMLTSKDPVLRSAAADHLAKTIMGGVMLGAGYLASRHATPGKPYLVEIDDDETGKKTTIDTRYYRPFDLYMTAGAYLGHKLFGDPRPALNANELFDVATNLRRMTDQPISALYPIFQQLASGNEYAQDELLSKIMAQMYGPLITPILAMRDNIMAATTMGVLTTTKTMELGAQAGEAVGALEPGTTQAVQAFGQTAAEKLFGLWYAKGDIATNPGLAAVSNISRTVANTAGQTMGGDPHHAVTQKIDPFTGKQARIQQPFMFWALGLPMDEVEPLERAIMKAGLDPIKTIDPKTESPLYANVYRKILGKLITAPIADPSLPHDLVNAKLAGEGVKISVPQAVKTLIQETGLTKEQVAKPEVLDPDFANALQNVQIDPRAMIRLYSRAYLEPVYGREGAAKIVSSKQTVGDLVAAIIEDDRVAQHFVVNQKMSVEDARQYVARTAINILKMRIGGSVDWIADSIRVHAPWLLNEHYYRALPPEVRRTTTPANIRELAAKSLFDLHRTLAEPDLLSNPFTAPIAKEDQ